MKGFKYSNTDIYRDTDSFQPVTFQQLDRFTTDGSKRIKCTGTLNAFSLQGIS